MPMQANAISPDEVVELIKWRAEIHNAPVDIMLNVAFCESRYNPDAIGKRGERGIFQYLPGRGNAWDLTSFHRLYGTHIATLYENHDKDATYFDVDMAAEIFASSLSVARLHWRSTYGKVC